MKIGDYVKYKELSKSGKEYWISGVVINIDERTNELFNNMGNNTGEDYRNITILTEFDEEIRKFAKDLEPDIQLERDVKIKRIFGKL